MIEQGDLLFALKEERTRFSHEHKNVILEKEENPDRTVRPVVCLQRGAPQHFRH